MSIQKRANGVLSLGSKTTKDGVANRFLQKSLWYRAPKESILFVVEKLQDQPRNMLVLKIY